MALLRNRSTTIHDSNENDPPILYPPYSRIIETANKNELVGDPLNATAVEFGESFFSITGGNTDTAFRIETCGVKYMYNSDAFDYEKQTDVNDFNLTVTLTDDGGGLSTAHYLCAFS